MADKKGVGPLIGVAAVVLVGATVKGCANAAQDPKKLDVGGGQLPAAAGVEAPYSVSTLPPIGTAAQDPGGGGGGGGRPGTVGPPGIQGAQGSGSAQGFQGGGDKLYFSGVN